MKNVSLYVLIIMTCSLSLPVMQEPFWCDQQTRCGEKQSLNMYQQKNTKPHHLSQSVSYHYQCHSVALFNLLSPSHSTPITKITLSFGNAWSHAEMHSEDKSCITELCQSFTHLEIPGLHKVITHVYSPTQSHNHVTCTLMIKWTGLKYTLQHKSKKTDSLMLIIHAKSSLFSN